MNFKFYPIESRISDFLEFPRLLIFKEEYEDPKSDQNYQELIDDEYSSFLRKTEEKLKPFANDIKIFYMENIVDKYDFISLISKANTIFNYKNEEEYLNMLLTLTDHEIRRSIVYSLMLADQEFDTTTDAAMKEAEKICTNNKGILSYIKDLQIDAGYKWNLFLIIEAPSKYMKLYFELMNKLLPVFHEVYSNFEEEVNRYGNYLVAFLNKNGIQGFEDLTYSILDTTKFEFEIENILISPIYSYALTIFPFDKNKHIVWGLKLEEAFKKVKEINENKTYERVQIFKNLGDKTRYEVLKLIASGQTSTKEIANALGVSSATISYHLNAFLTSKVIKMDKLNNKIVYVVDYKLLEKTLEGFKVDLNFPKA